MKNSWQKSVKSARLNCMMANVLRSMIKNAREKLLLKEIIIM
jgi:hypothetical protein